MCSAHAAICSSFTPPTIALRCDASRTPR
jgi:hypothetical protein